ILAAAAIRSCTRMSLETAAAISGVIPGAREVRRTVVASSESSQSRNSDRNVGGSGDKVLHAHELGNGSGHFGRNTGGEGGEAHGGGFVRKQPIAQFRSECWR